MKRSKIITVLLIVVFGLTACNLTTSNNDETQTTKNTIVKTDGKLKVKFNLNDTAFATNSKAHWEAEVSYDGIFLTNAYIRDTTLSRFDAPAVWTDENVTKVFVLSKSTDPSTYGRCGTVYTIEEDSITDVEVVIDDENNGFHGIWADNHTLYLFEFNGYNWWQYSWIDGELEKTLIAGPNKTSKETAKQSPRVAQQVRLEMGTVRGTKVNLLIRIISLIDDGTLADPTVTRNK